MYEYIPQKTDKTAGRLILLFLAGGFGLMFLTVLIQGIPCRWAFQFAAIGLLTEAVLLVTRYVTRSFVYRIEESEDGEIELTVIQVTSGGKKQTVVCRLAMCQIKKIDRFTREEEKAVSKEAHKKREQRRIFDYTVDLHLEKAIQIVAEEYEEAVTVRLNDDERLYEIIKSKLTAEE